MNYLHQYGQHLAILVVADPDRVKARSPGLRGLNHAPPCK
jgi:hypothetical protein